MCVFDKRSADFHKEKKNTYRFLKSFCDNLQDIVSQTNMLVINKINMEKLMPH